MKPLVSIGLPVKDGFKNRSADETNVKKTLNSILNQTYKNLEIIISNNCSIDETNKFLDDISKTDHRIKLFNQKKELSWAENYKFVLEKSSGKYFKWNAADDQISNDYIKENLFFLENNLDYICSSSKFFYENNKNKIYKFNLEENLYSRLKGFFKIRHISHNILHSLIRKEVMNKTIDISKDYWAVDWIFDLDLLINGKFKTLNEGFVMYGTKGMSRQKNFILRNVYKKKFIYKIFPFYELMKHVFLKTYGLKKISIIERISIYVSLIKINFYFIKKKIEKN